MATPKTERLLNLVICLMSARQFVTAEFLRANVVGYKDSEQSQDSFKRMLERDKNDLRELGIPLETGRNPLGGEEGYRIKPEHYALPDISLESDEAAAIAAAAALWHDPEVAAETQSAILKLRAAGIDVGAPEELGFGGGGGARAVGDEREVRALLAAIDDARAVTFTHRSGGGKSTRTLEPWGVVSHSGRWYVVGHDRDRDDVRTFRLSRVTAVTAIGDVGAVSVPPGTDLPGLVAAAVQRAGRERGTAPARIWLADDRAHGLRRLAVEFTDHEFDGEAGQLAVIDIHSRSALVRAILAAGPDAVVLEPAELRTAVIEELDRLTAALTEGARR